MLKRQHRVVFGFSQTIQTWGNHYESPPCGEFLEKKSAITHKNDSASLSTIDPTTTTAKLRAVLQNQWRLKQEQLLV